MEYTCHYFSPLGGITISCDGEALTGLQFDAGPDTAGPDRNADLSPVLAEAVRWLDIYFSGRAPDFTPPLRMNAAAFRTRVWELLLTIPYGKTVTYAQIAEQIAAERGIPRMSAQAVGGAVGHNGILLIIPCHRVVGADGSLTGYAGGLDRKRRLLALEGAVPAGQWPPHRGPA